MVTYLAVASILPVAALFIVSLQPFWSGSFAVSFNLTNYSRIFDTGTQTFEGLKNSLTLAVVGASIGMLVALLVAYRVSGRRQDRLSRWLDGTTKLPGALSHVVVAIGFLVALAGPPFNLHGSVLLLLLAYVVLYIPQATVTAQSAFLQVGKEVTEASLISGEGPGGTLRRIALPLMVPGMTAGWAFVFVLIVGDITASAILASTNSPVVGFVILNLFQNSTYPVLAALATVITLLSSVIVLGALAIAGRRRAHLS